MRAWIKTGVPLARADGSGLTFTLSAAGTAAWVLRYRFGGAPRELTLGRYPDLSLAEARKLARLHRVRIQQGEDVARAKRREKQAAAWTFAQLVHDYKLKAFPILAVSTREQRERHLALACQRLGGLAARDVDPADIVLLIEQIGARSRSTAEVVLIAVAETFKHGIARRVVVANPCAGVTVGAVCGPPEYAPVGDADRAGTAGAAGGATRHRDRERLGGENPVGDLRPHQRTGVGGMVPPGFRQGRVVHPTGE